MGISTTKIGDLEIAIEQAGQGPDLLFIGGTNWDLRVRPGPLESLLIDSFKVTLFDQRGMGLSAKPPGPYTMAQYARDAAGVIDTLSLERPLVVGYSFGGMVAQELAISFPEKTRALVLAATAAGGAGGASFPLHTLTGLDPRSHAIRSIEIADTGFTDHWRAANPEAAEERIRLRLEKDARFADEPGRLEGAAAQLEARSHHNTFDRLHHIEIPTLVLCGDRDGLASAQASANMANAIPDCRHQTVSGSHSFLHEAEDGYAAIRDFFVSVINS